MKTESTQSLASVVQSRFVRRLVEARENVRWSQADLAKMTGLQPAAVSHFETGQRLPSVPNLVRLANALQVSTDWLLGWDDSRPLRVVEIDGVRYFPSPNTEAQATPTENDHDS